MRLPTFSNHFDRLPVFRAFRRWQQRLSPSLSRDCRFDTLEKRTLMSTVPNDPGYADQWGLSGSNAESAWDAGTGSAAVVVGHIDSGIDYTHEDLYLNVWINQAEIPKALKKKLVDTDADGLITFYDLNNSANAAYVHDGNANGHIDAGDLLRPWKANLSGGWEDGRNGKSYKGDKYVDDIIGWDFGDNDNNPMDDDGHGTHTAGTIGAIGNNGVGTAGVVWKTSLMALKIFGNGQDGASDADIAAAIRYAADNGVKITSNSYGGSGGTTDGLYRALVYAEQKGMLMVYAAGNDGVNNDSSWDASYPATYDLSNIISVAASNSGSSLTSWSNYGETSVDLAAPGDDIYSTYLDGTYETESGTSMATPHVAGTLALMLSQNPSLTAAQLKSQLLAGVNQQSSILGQTVTGGTLDIANATKAVAGSTATAPAQDQTPVFWFVPRFGFWGYGGGYAYNGGALSAYPVTVTPTAGGWAV
ncbi:S8 family peptidase [Humisphaera borealis]|uniref:S8 family serine peptidase n=1 Tax=Humisphaera borealis TaxID=2807512 RepID=A0A7M2WY44_9BACT|nr:S8 family peptidase [Humisphaera borealis]QOV90395.1 S8 family serine peptidase [Humisphaera borealis]